jgi:Holliday junction resolvasome RuvABC endonuclease subunit
MTLDALRQELVLGLYPTPHGFGWILFEGPLAAHDWGTSVTRTNKNATCLARIEAIIERYAPGIIVLEQFERGATVRADRLQHLCRAIVHLANNRGIETRVYSRAAIRTCFASIGARTRQEIAQAIATHVDALRPRTPPLRKAWMSEDDRMSLFNAAALALTHYALTGSVP